MNAMRAFSQWMSIVASPLVFLANLSLAYALAPIACETQRHAALHLSNGIALVLTVGAGLLAWHALQSPPPQGAPRESVSRMAFLSQVGIGMSALTALAVLLQWSTQWALESCIA